MVIPLFYVLLRIHAREGKWDSTGDVGILKIVTNDILTDDHSIDDDQVEDAIAARTSNRSIQNSKAIYNCVKFSITGDIKDIISSQFDNLSTTEDGIGLFKKLTTFTTVSLLQLPVLSFNSIMNFNPANYDYNVPVVNSKLIHFFVFTTTSTRQLLESELIQHVFNAYINILQPEIWAQWVRAKGEAFEEGTITKSQDFMNTATIKYNKIIGKDIFFAFQ